ncbi:hypothetical protein CFIO01_04660 [Colletotrichum fioriniae PJ7]|uniref:Uncharacterized protein n=1 Tax=Colletotrichum fioriniae PJ7 TaxID=1445577 RepID=A0A010R5F8_9PEZI|nr:hypothetical protein CFIO01_04660 [Colletotrichum fioriniae PJ7]
MAQPRTSQKEENARFRTNSGWCCWPGLLGLRPYARGETERHDREPNASKEDRASCGSRSSVYPSTDIAQIVSTAPMAESFSQGHITNDVAPKNQEPPLP